VCEQVVRELAQIGGIHSHFRKKIALTTACTESSSSTRHNTHTPTTKRRCCVAETPPARGYACVTQALFCKNLCRNHQAPAALPRTLDFPHKCDKTPDMTLSLAAPHFCERRALRDVYKASCSCTSRALEMSDIQEWKGGDFCCSWCTAEEGSTSADACMSCILPCYTFAMIQTKGDKSSSFCGNFLLFGLVDMLGFGCCMVCATRSHINGHENCCRNCMSSYFCAPCALVQAYKTIEARDSAGNFVPPYDGQQGPLLNSMQE